METLKIESIRGLGMKDFGMEGNGLDTSSGDGGPVLREWQGLFGLLQPDVITFFNHNGEVQSWLHTGFILSAVYFVYRYIVPCDTSQGNSPSVPSTGISKVFAKLFSVALYL